MPTPNPRLSGLSIQQYNAVFALEAIQQQRRVNEMLSIPEIALSVAGSGVNTYGAGRAVSTRFPGRKAAAFPPAAPPFDHRNRSIVFLKHAAFPEGLRLVLAREDGAPSAFAAAGAVAMSGVTLTYAPATPEGWINGSRATPRQPVRLFDDSVAENNGTLHLQLGRTPGTTLAPYDPSLDLGNAGRAILSVLTPITPLQHSGRAPEYAPETTNLGPAFLMFRPVFDVSQTPVQPFVDTGATYPDGIDDLITPAFRTAGCFASEKEIEDSVEYAETVKDFENNVVDNVKIQDRTDINVLATGDSPYLAEILNAGEITMNDASMTEVSSSPYLPKFEVIMFTMNSSGYLRGWIIDVANIIKNGNHTPGSRDGEGARIPVKIKGWTAPRRLYGNALYQMADLAIRWSIV